MAGHICRPKRLLPNGGGNTESFLPDIARQQLMALNPGLVTAANVDDVLRRLRLVQPTIVGNEDILKALRGHWTVAHLTEQREYNLILIDFDNLDVNQFHFIQELPFDDLAPQLGRHRPDVVLFINGLPLVIIENKSPTRPTLELEAHDQVQRLYTENIPNFLPPVICGCTMPPPGTIAPKLSIAGKSMAKIMGWNV